MPASFVACRWASLKYGGHGDDRLRHFLAEVIFRRLLQLLQNHRGDLWRGILLALRHHRDVVARLHDLVRHHLHFFGHFVEAASHEPLDRVNSVLRVGDGLAFRHLPDQSLAGLGKADDRGRSPPSFFIRDHLGLATLHHSYAGVSGSQVNSDNFGHNWLLLKLLSAL